MRVSLLQLEVDRSRSFDERRERALAQVAAQRGADLVVLPELWPSGGFAAEAWAAEAEPLDGPTVAALAEAARGLGCHLHGGSFVERGADGRLFNTSVLFGPDGGLVGVYRKVHTFGFDSGEAAVMGHGDEAVVRALPFGGLGLATCYDLRFPEQFRLLLDGGMEVLALPAAWPLRRIDHWSLLARARAVENQVFVLACNTAGEHAGVRLGGHSAVIDPWGAVLAEAGEEEGVVTADIEPGEVARVRRVFPVLRDRRLGCPAPETAAG